MKRRRRLRKLVPDAELIRRRAAGEPLRQLKPDYDVAHTTLGRYFERPEVAKQIKQAAVQLRAEQRAEAARRSAKRRLEQEVRRKAREQAAREREDARRARAALEPSGSHRRSPTSQGVGVPGTAGGRCSDARHGRHLRPLRMGARLCVREQSG
jgi:hypothetical protein